MPTHAAFGARRSILAIDARPQPGPRQCLHVIVGHEGGVDETDQPPGQITGHREPAGARPASLRGDTRRVID